MPIALPADHDDDLRGIVRRVTDRDRAGCGVRIASPARYRARRWAARLAVVDPLHDPGHLPLPRSLEPLPWRFAAPVATGRGPDRRAASVPGGGYPWRRRMMPFRWRHGYPP